MSGIFCVCLVWGVGGGGDGGGRGVGPPCPGNGTLTPLSLIPQKIFLFFFCISKQV